MSDYHIREARPGATISLQALGFPSGQVPSFRLIALVGGAVVIDPITAGITEDSPGNYDMQFAVPDDLVAGDYSAEWQFGEVWARDEDIIRVTDAPLGPGFPSYSIYSEFQAWMSLNGAAWTGTENEANDLLLLAERDIDRAVGPYRRQANGLKFGEPSGSNMAGLDEDQISQLSRVTCAQAEFRLQLGRDFFIEDQRESTSGPDYSEQGRLPKIGPRARAELQESGLLKLTGRMGRNR